MIQRQESLLLFLIAVILCFWFPKINGGVTAQIVEGVSILTASKDHESSLEINGHGVLLPIYC